MARKYLVSLDLNRNEIQNAVVQVLATAPSTPTEGQIYYDSVAHAPYIWNGSAWQTLTGSTISFGTPGNSAVGDTAAAGSSGSAARADHVHGRESFGTTASTQAVGDTAAGGSATTPSRSDHKHALPGFGSTTAQTAFGQASASGSATTIARSDHTHGTPAHDATAHSTIKVSDLAAPTTSVAFNGQKITGLADPTLAQDAATKAYVDAYALGLDFKQSVRAATTTNITLTAPGASIDGVSLTAGDRVLVKNQSTGSANGIYIWNGAAATMTRASDADTSAEVTAGSFVFVEEGTTQADTSWVLATNNPITLGTTALSFTQFGAASSYTAGDGITLTGNAFSVNAVASGGITVSASGVAVDPAVVARRYAVDLTTSLTAYTITHNLNTRDVQVQIYSTVSPWETVECDVERTTVNTCTIRFATAPASGAYRAVVIG